MRGGPENLLRNEPSPPTGRRRTNHPGTPPNDTAGQACDAFDQMVRANFTPREIGMLFGYASNCPESLIGGIGHLQRRYQAVVQEYVAAQQRTGPTSVAAR